MSRNGLKLLYALAYFSWGGIVIGWVITYPLGYLTGKQHMKDCFAAEMEKLVNIKILRNNQVFKNPHILEIIEACSENN